ncbi:glutamate--cysteine ligase [Congregibacter variabilis]|uniref:Glutamate--cysteine ligase n=1 Tax=Congregibacter variabilis TaxID=3081200 RepID=A0ABZ0I6Y6_9GAMM|nr:glutamate--cysteine ligase [Congregibacter sp. IMCC43200]
MGIEINKTTFDAEDRRLFSQRLESQLQQLSTLIGSPGFGRPVETIGAELELYIVDADGKPAYLNDELCSAAADPQLTVELNKYNLEYNLSPQSLSDEGFLATEREVVAKLERLSALAAQRGAFTVPIGILPTLAHNDLGDHCITDRQRYRALVAQLIAWRGSDFHININGADPLQMTMANITLEGANTSFQVHQRVSPKDYAATFNAIQMTTPLAIAISANSPGLFGHQLWDETRIPLFKQSIDTRDMDRYRWSEPPRVCFGHGWVRSGAFELFEQTVRLYPPLLPACDAQLAQDSGHTPTLAELRLHQSTVWLWNRAIYDDADEGHLRIEMRSLPAGPTPVDMVAGAAFMLGLARGLRDDMDSLMSALPFHLAEYNFYRSAQHGLDARLVWPSLQQHRLRDASVVDIIAEMLPVADDGLRALGVAQAERDRYLGVIDARLSARRNGSSWQREATQALIARGRSKPNALKEMLTHYRVLSAQNIPVAEWPMP